MPTYLATWGAPGPRIVTPAIVQPPIVVIQPAISDTAFRRKKKRRLVEQILKPVEPAKATTVISAVTAAPKPNFRTLAELSGKSIDILRAEMDPEIAELLDLQQERDDEEALTLILAALED